MTDTSELKTITRAQWIEALRSGKYRQAKGKLKDLETGGFCCLGVACDLAGVDFNKMTRVNLSDLNMDKITVPVAEMLGLNSSYCYRLANMNDTKNSFNYIANYIENELE